MTHRFADVPADRLPEALAGLHRATAVGARVEVVVGGSWSRPHLVDVLTGAGFGDPVVDVTDEGLRAAAVRARTLADVVGPGMRLLLCGLNPSLYAADAGVGFARPGNRFWPAALAAGIVSLDRDPWHALRHHGVGFTDLVKRASASAAELTTAELRDGLARVARLCAWLQPRVVCFLGLSGWRAAVDRTAAPGWQAGELGGSRVYVMHNPSGLNAHARVETLAAHLRAAAS